jgi:galactose mutarotase-like enzyme
MIVQMRNDKLAVEIDTLGAELSSVKTADGKTEFIWQADPAVWNRHAPILFPIVGKLKDNQYTYDNQQYGLPQHGFARDSQFNLVEETDSKAIFELVENEKSLKSFPFRFNLKVTYQLTDNRLAIGYQVTNPKKSPLYFSIGGHPGFCCPIHAEDKLADYFLEFEVPETAKRFFIEDGLIGQAGEILLENEKRINLSESLFDQGALVFKQLKSNSITLKNNNHGHKVVMEFDNFTHFGIWSKPGRSNFVCLEPWYGIADPVDSSGVFIEKEGLIKLEPNQVFSCHYRISFFE